MSDYYLDFEFVEDGASIDPISLGIVGPGGQELYMEFVFDESKITPWLKENVIPHLEWSREARVSKHMAQDMILDFIGYDPNPRFIGYYADYDWVCFCQIFGTMMDLPRHFPRYCYDLQQLWVMLGRPHIKPSEPENEHHALADARWNVELHERLKKYARNTHATGVIGMIL